MTNMLDAEYWTRRYREKNTGWDIGEASRPLKEYIDQLANKELSILIPGAGNAYEAEYLLNSGFCNVTVCDLSAEPLTHLRQRVGKSEKLSLIQGDFFDLEGQFDLILEQTFFCALHPKLRQAYFSKMAALLKPGGVLAGVLFNDALNTDSPPFGGNREEYLGYVPQELEVEKMNPCYNSIPPRAGRELFIQLRKKLKQ